MGDPYMDPNYDPYQDMTDGDMLAMYAQMNPQLFGKDPAKRLNYMQDLFQTLGTDLVQTAGVTNPANEVPQYLEPMNQTGSIYGSDPLYASVFQAIEDGADPISAAKAAKDAGLFTGTPEEFNTQVVSVATQYAGEKVKNQQARLQWEADNAEAIGGWTMPDGSKTKGTPLGGNDVRATASEYDLAGYNADDLFKQYQERMGVTNAPLNTFNPGSNVSLTVGPERGGRQGRSGSRGPVAAPQPVVFSGNSNLPPGAVDYTPNPGGGGGITENLAPFVASRPPSRETPAPIQGKNPPPPKGPRSAFFQNIDKLGKDSINRRVEQSKGNMVRSDANRNLMRRITALAGLLQGGFPE
jgi:hypothetical protein